MGDAGDWGGKPIVSQENWRRGTEYGGAGGIIAPLDSPHNPADEPGEQLMLIYNTDPTDPNGEPIAPLKKFAD